VGFSPELAKSLGKATLNVTSDIV
jgi:hypothetical protein